MKVIEAQKILYDDIKSILESAGLKNGLGADKTGILFYPARKETTLPIGDTFLTYEVYYIQEAGRADEKPESQLGTIAIDVFTKKDRTSSQIMDMLSKIEDEAIKRGYRLEVKQTDSYDSDNQLAHLSYDLKKRIR
jgi:hypothetical protein